MPRPRASAAATPSVTPSAASRRPWPTTSLTTSAPPAPRAIRMPISRPRHLLRALAIGHVRHRLWRLGEAAIAHVADDADDRPARPAAPGRKLAGREHRLRRFEQDLAADRVLAGEEPAGERLVDDGHPR